MRDKFITASITIILALSTWTLNEVLKIKEQQINNNVELKFRGVWMAKTDANLDILLKDYYSTNQKTQ